MTELSPPTIMEPSVDKQSLIHDLRPYPAYKDSGIPWLGEVPVHWGISRSKRLFSARKTLALPGDVQLSATQAYGVIPQSEFEEKVGRRVTKISMHLEKRRHVERDDFVISMRSFQGGLERAWASGAIRSSYVVLRPEPGVDVGFFAYLFKSHGYVRALQATADFIRDGQDLNYSNFCRVDLPAVPVSEQATIVRFLDHADRRIRRYIHTKQKLIKLLEEQKQCTIQRAVTHGIDPTVCLKPSGVPWLGDVPEHWEVIPLRRVTISRCDGPFGSGLKSSHYTDHGIRVIRLQNIGHAQFLSTDAAFISSVHYTSLGDHSVEVGDVLIAGLGDERHPTGRACVAPAGIAPAMVKADCFRFRLNTARLHPEFAALNLTATAAVASAILSTGATRQRINLQSTAGRTILVPPRVEQEDIVAHVAEWTIELNFLIDKTHREIMLLREYRTRLIADVVTGKLDVREAVAKLPAEVSEAEEVDDAELLADGEDELPDEGGDAEAAE